jgi:hypothetical protein
MLFLRTGKGKEKLSFVRTTIEDLYPQAVEIWPMIEKMIASAVSMYNATGTFKKEK